MTIVGALSPGPAVAVVGVFLCASYGTEESQRV